MKFQAQCTALFLILGGCLVSSSAQAVPTSPTSLLPPTPSITERLAAQHGTEIVDGDLNSNGDRLGHLLSVSLSPLALAGGAFLLADSHHHVGEAPHALEGIAVTGLATLVLKKAVNEQRPHGGGGSFPSGHASLAFSMATAINEYHPHYRWFTYGAAAAISAARVEVDAHYWHDVFAGAALGFFTTKYFMRQKHSYGINILPNGMGFQKQF